MNHSQQERTTETAPRSIGERLGVTLYAADAPTLLSIIEAAEAAGVRQLWMTQGPTTHDSLTVYAAAMMRTHRVRFGTSIVPIYPRHPLALAQQAATVAALGPGRLRLGVGPSHRPTIEGAYNIPMTAPLVQLKEYVTVLRAILWDGQVDQQGRFFTAKASLPNPPRIPLLISALGEGAYRLAGEVADGVISWNCPPNYLLNTARPALQAGAQAAHRAVPTLIAQAWVALSQDVTVVRAAAKQRLASYARLPFYANMFATAGYPLEADGRVSDALVDNLVISGNEASIAARMNELLANGIDELLLTLLVLKDETSERARLFELVGRM